MSRTARPLARRFVLAAFGVYVLLQTTPRLGASEPAMLGFAPASRGKQIEAEARALAVPTPKNARALLRTLTAEPHTAGTLADQRTAKFVHDRLKEWGWSVEIVPYEVLLNHPSVPPKLEIVRPEPAPLDLEEKPLATDKDSANSLAFPAFNGYGVSGTAAGQVVYANYARPEDFDALEKLGVSVKDKIVLSRYGGLFRGLKVLNAQKRGAKGILIYSDPGDDGYAKGDVYPAGPFRPESAVQRGSVQFLSLGPGDPSTPRGPSIPGADRLPIDLNHGLRLDDPEWDKNTGLKRGEYFATIPSLPVGYGAAREILKLLAGSNVPDGWQGGLPLAYHVGPGPVELKFSVWNEYKVRTIWNVVAKIPGAVEPDRWVMVGNHRDAWVYGAVDPGSGTAATLETCRALGEAVRTGWKPRRTIVYASWDAEEYGLVGSTEWAEQFTEEIDRKAALMLNVDVAVAGPDLDMGGVPSLRDLMLEAAGAVTDVRSGRSLRDVWLESKRNAWVASSPLVLIDPFWTRPTSVGDPPSSPRGFTPQLHPLGSGSDYTAFLDHLGVPALDVGFSGKYGVYHSMYDDFNWMEKFGDPEFLTHTMAARLYTVLLMRAANADVLPFRFVPYAEALRDHVDELRLIRARKVRKSAKPGTRPDEDFEGLGDLAESVLRFQAEARSLDKALDALAAKDGARAEALAPLNEALTRLERAFLLPGGLEGRSWFKHAIYAPGVTTGYAAWPLPAVREALEASKSENPKSAVSSTTTVIDAATAALKRASALARDAATGL
ncbi:MAG: M28 family metallopeptidase [Paludisphaera borealis]|uniref:M28 family metallopeptidase n=1 Tax=Paludisphaera borealis TaxID=1387353 RepID=UPI0028404223|nr:M28 family metallopeptidase [Paludisphaera borealis]MDR3619793.1 M28 family metallopeptidase [Paludisphaera borealis]